LEEGNRKSRKSRLEEIGKRKVNYQLKKFLYKKNVVILDFYKANYNIKVDWKRKVRDSCGNSGTGETPQER
jgi:hypothetical protein